MIGNAFFGKNIPTLAKMFLWCWTYIILEKEATFWLYLIKSIQNWIIPHREQACKMGKNYKWYLSGRPRRYLVWPAIHPKLSLLFMTMSRRVQLWECHTSCPTISSKPHYLARWCLFRWMSFLSWHLFKTIKNVSVGPGKSF
jgi:hypothetical protein